MEEKLNLITKLLEKIKKSLGLPKNNKVNKATLNTTADDRPPKPPTNG